MRIDIKLGPDSIRDAAEMLENYAKRLENAEEAIQAELCTTAANEAAKHFDGDVMVVPAGDRVIATGESVVFQEFGAGATISDPYPDGAEVDFEIRRGAYSDMTGGEYARTGYEYWHHDGEKYTQVVPVHGLFYGMMAAKDAIPEIVKGVLEK